MMHWLLRTHRWSHLFCVFEWIETVKQPNGNGYEWESKHFITTCICACRRFKCLKCVNRSGYGSILAQLLLNFAIIIRRSLVSSSAISQLSQSFPTVQHNHTSKAICDQYHEVIPPLAIVSVVNDSIVQNWTDCSKISTITKIIKRSEKNKNDKQIGRTHPNQEYISEIQR